MRSLGNLVQLACNYFLSPPRGLLLFHFAAHSLRCGLYSFAALRRESCEPSFGKLPIQEARICFVALGCGNADRNVGGEECSRYRTLLEVAPVSAYTYINLQRN